MLDCVRLSLDDWVLLLIYLIDGPSKRIPRNAARVPWDVIELRELFLAVVLEDARVNQPAVS